MNKNTVYFLQRVLSAAASALVYALADKMVEKQRMPKRRPEWKDVGERGYRQQASQTRPGAPRSMRDQYRKSEKGKGE